MTYYFDIISLNFFKKKINNLEGNIKYLLIAVF